jgi:hypothetical protein
VISVWANVVAVKGGVYEKDDGITLRSLFSSAHLGWGDLDRFEHQRRGTHDFVYAYPFRGLLPDLGGAGQQ